MIEQDMSFNFTIVLAWFALSALPVALVMGIGLARMWARKLLPRRSAQTLKPPPTQVLVPVKGRIPQQETVLASLLEQTHPCYDVTFILESEDDPANETVDALCARYGHCRKLIAGIADLCAQKNHNLIAGIRELRPETEIVVFCDSTNSADSDWLQRFTSHLGTRGAQVVTTFRVFNPEPQRLWGICQAIYGAALFVALAVKPKPWGGATAIRRDILLQLDVAENWAKTIVDDLVLGNLLDRAGFKVLVAFDSRLTSPLPNQSLNGLLNYLDRQLVFPKFTNPGIWLATLIVLVNVAAAVGVALVMPWLSLAGVTDAIYLLAALAFLLVVECTVLPLRVLNPFGIPLSKWAVCAVPLVFLCAYLLVRSVFRDYLIWHGKRYRAGRGGVVMQVTAESGSIPDASTRKTRPWIPPKAV
ncbi:MAG: glycosyltransferase [Thermodesulfobacteriota bacterium]